jgi:hypothetical protein
MRFVVLMALDTKAAVLCDVTPISFVEKPAAFISSIQKKKASCSS